ncbi:hypothetical protein ASPZODRAFT_142614 [Penicilliopsis zonata CBS 506.65]|uniref:Zn(2)-C6 fungal-type domain-containing protein n=1 Tax=Penicilliopsis zonata CBS 506.65 TaxID=1073090 RepID=A0A1L9SFW8_9EURO|nr:hypothetical protein ASPZODRAFT_142614 [Penicilliopsis zonata CBS 506.65]OJJ45977.1 hypothetical protein ASPZODRAFT_142614 [Penicilliopsis zonata CBS 506.65]
MPRAPKRPGSSDSSPQSNKLGERSCRSCHQRKVRCDRRVPCTNCARYGTPCEYPTRDSDIPRKGPSLKDISDRLERLEVLLYRLVESQTTTGGGGGAGFETQQAQSGAKNQDNPHAESTWELLLDNSRVNTIQEEKQTVQSQTHQKKDHDAFPTQPDGGADMVSVLECYPDPQLALRLWNVYVKSVDPVLKILHIPSVQSTVVATILDPRSAPSSTVALTFAIYFAAITALCHDDREPVDLPCEEQALLKRYKMSLDRLLMVTELMNRPEIMALQALAIYATCLRAHEVGRGVWVLNGLAIRLAQSIGLHRDGASLQLSPFETEMRLRLWWHLCVLDSRAPEDQGFQPTVDVTNRGLRLPLNVNDNQIYPDMKSLPVESHGWTEMSFFLIQTASCRLLHPILDIQEQHSADTLLNIVEKRKIMDEHRKHLSARYGELFGSGTPTDLSRIAFQHITTARKKMEFVLQLREEISTQKQDVTPDVLKLSFNLACDGLESSRVLLKDGLASRFKWFFSMYTQWYALAYVLRCLCTSPGGSETDRAWALVEEMFPQGLRVNVSSEGMHDDHGGSIWRCLNRLRQQALSLRQLSSSGHCTSQIPETEATAHGTATIPELGEFIDANQSIFSSLDLSMPEIPLLPDWNAVINGCLTEDSSYFNFNVT